MATILNNNAQITYNYDTNTDTAQSNTVTTTLLDDYSLLATKTSNNQNYRPGENITYNIRLENNGIEPIYVASISDNLGGTPPLLTLLDNSITIIKDDTITTVTPISTNPLVINIPGIINPGEVVFVIYVAKVNQLIDTTINNIENIATVTAHEESTTGPLITADPVPSVTLPLANYAEVKIEKEVDKHQITNGQELTYTFTLTNNGNIEATNIVLKDKLPANFNVTSIESKTNNIITNYETTDYTIDTENNLTLPTSAKTISVPAKTNQENGITTITIKGVVNA